MFPVSSLMELAISAPVMYGIEGGDLLRMNLGMKQNPVIPA
jgi:hypothetical protein